MPRFLDTRPPLFKPFDLLLDMEVAGGFGNLPPALLAAFGAEIAADNRHVRMTTPATAQPFVDLTLTKLRVTGAVDWTVTRDGSLLRIPLAATLDTALRAVIDHGHADSR